jgi:hypothetical protein
MRPLLLASLASLVLCGAGTPARACVNDREVDRSERQFKSQYNIDPPAGDPVPGYAPKGQANDPLVWLGGGSLLFLGACALCLRRGPRP